MVVVASAVSGMLTRRFLLATDSRQRQVSREAAAGELARVARGIYVAPTIWENAGPTERHVLLVAGVVQRPGWRGVVSHESAAALLGWPRVTPYPTRVQVTDPFRESSRSSPLIRWHAAEVDDSEVVQIDGMLVTNSIRTLRDVLTTAHRVDAVALADFALARGIVPRLDARSLGITPGSRGSRRAQDAIEFADPGAETPGESQSRVVIDELGFPAPQTQVWFDLADGRRARVDFWWPDEGVVGEFDGKVKYTRSGQNTAETVYREKRREDGIRRHATVTNVARWGRYEVERPPLLAGILYAAGLRLR